MCGKSANYPLNDYIEEMNAIDFKNEVKATEENIYCCYSLSVVSPLT